LFGRTSFNDGKTGIGDEGGLLEVRKLIKADGDLTDELLGGVLEGLVGIALPFGSELDSSASGALESDGSSFLFHNNN